jgi:hypothetical protein
MSFVSSLRTNRRISRPAQQGAFWYTMADVVLSDLSGMRE